MAGAAAPDEVAKPQRRTEVAGAAETDKMAGAAVTDEAV
jgi:hypothetical protein